MPPLIIRPAVADDARAVAEIYNHYVATSPVTFDTEPKTEVDRRTWIEERDASHPVLVAIDASDRIVGFGALSAHSPRPAWSRTVEAAVYVHESAVGGGIGPRILDALISAGRAAGHHVIVSRIVAVNHASLKMVERAGFETVGVMREVGRKFDTWLDVVMLQLMLEEGE